MTEQVVQSRTETRPIIYYDPVRNPFTPTITTCGCRAFTKCAGTGNSNFMLSDESHICETCKGTKNETYLETSQIHIMEKLMMRLNELFVPINIKNKLMKFQDI
jgi:hypothetical protein